MIRSSILLAALASAAVLVIGCGNPSVSVKGSVSYAGHEVDRGSIAFLPEPGTQSQKASATITGGKYEIPAERCPSPGTFKIQITWAKKTGRRVRSADGGMLSDELREAIPGKYNHTTVLVRDIKPGINVLDFQLTP